MGRLKFKRKFIVTRVKKIMKNFWKICYSVIAVSLLVFSGSALAISAICIQATQVGIPACAAPLAGGPAAGQAACVARIQANHPECFGSSTAAASQGIQSTAVQQMLVISTAIGARTAMSQNRSDRKVAGSAQHSGMAAGNPAAQWNFWGSVNSDKNKYDRGGYVDAAAAIRNNKNNMNITNIVLGGDYQLSQAAVAGFSAAFDSGSGTGESFATVGGILTSQGVAVQGTRGYTVAPYVGWQINQDWSLDAALGLGNVKTDTDGIKGKANRLFYGANLNYVSYKGNWQLTGKGSYLHGQEKSVNLTNALGALMAGTAATNKIDQLRFGAQAGYWINDNAMPYLGITYANDISRSTSIAAAAQLGNELGKNAVVYTVGVNFFSIQNSMTGGISYNQEMSRTYAKNNSLMANINFRF